VCDPLANLVCRYRSQAQQQKHYSSCICIYFPLKFNEIPQRLFDPLLCGWLLLSFWLNAIASKVTKFTTIKTIHIFVFFTAMFSMLAFMLLFTSIPHLPYLGLLHLPFLCLEPYDPCILVLDMKALFISFSARSRSSSSST